MMSKFAILVFVFMITAVSTLQPVRRERGVRLPFGGLDKRQQPCPSGKHACDEDEFGYWCFEVCCYELIFLRKVGGCDRGNYCYYDLDSWNCCPNNETCTGRPKPCTDAVATFTTSVETSYTRVCNVTAPVCTSLPGEIYSCTGAYEDYLTMSSSIFATVTTTTTEPSKTTSFSTYYVTQNTTVPSTAYPMSPTYSIPSHETSMMTTSCPTSSKKEPQPSETTISYPQPPLLSTSKVPSSSIPGTAVEYTPKVITITTSDSTHIPPISTFPVGSVSSVTNLPVPTYTGAASTCAPRFGLIVFILGTLLI